MRRRILQIVGLAALVTVIAGIAAPFLHADRYRTRLASSLSRALGRTVTVGEVRLDVFTGPGFSIHNVTIGGVGGQTNEPFAYVDEVRAVPRIWSLWSGNLQFSSLTLEGAHVNLTRSTAGWDFETLLRPNLLAAFPTLRLRDSRINFKFGQWKDPFYLLNTDLDVSPLKRDGSEWQVRFVGEPTRTDRPAHGFGELQATGRWIQPAGSAGQLAFDCNLERSELGDVLSLVNGRDTGVRGLVSGRVHVAGPVASAGVEGELRVAELHGWEESPPPGGVFTFRISGLLNGVTQHLDLNAEPRRNMAPLKAHLIVDHYLETASWTFDAHSNGLPLVTFPGLLRNFGVNVPDALHLSGSIDADLSYAAPEGWKGQATIADASMQVKGVPTLQFHPALLSLASGVAHLQQVEVQSEKEPIGSVAADYSLRDGSFDVDIASAGGPVSTLLKTFPNLSIPLLSSVQKANWKGDLRFASAPNTPEHWTGTGELTDATVALPFLAGPLDVASAEVQVEGDAIRMDNLVLNAGDLEAHGEYRYAPLAERPHQFRLTVATADAAQLEALFRPVLQRRGNLLDFALGRATPPAWLRNLHAEGTLQAGTLLVSGTPLSRFRSRVQWDGAEIVFPEWQSHVASASMTGRSQIDLRGSAPAYTAALQLRNVDWQGGKMDGDLRLRTSGTGLTTLANLRMEGTFSGRNVELLPIGVVDQLTGEGDMAWSGESPQFRFQQVRLVSEGNTWTGSGGSQAPGEVVLRLSTGARQINLVGSLTNPTQPWTERP